ncbi:MAG: hypothetical protein A2Z16_09585 [Chloroflexi bacterium RBG_16_54_18]|nr:MAG: hypothetical protein A2Z16_09585 [Chloroflexi bacterium RBG_16_54_18]
MASPAGWGLKIDGAIINEPSGNEHRLFFQIVFLFLLISMLENQPMWKMTRNNKYLHVFMRGGWGEESRFAFGGRNA